MNNFDLGEYLGSNFIFGVGLFLTVVGLAAIVSGFFQIYEDASEPLIAGGSGLATAGGVLIALGTFVRASEESTSQFYLQKATDGLREAYKLLQDGNNDRVTWILAARTLARARRLSEQITKPAHQDAFAIEEDIHRINFGAVLKSDQRSVASFFVGSNNPTEPLQTAAQGARRRHGLQALPESALIEIYKAASYPSEYDDPLPRRFNDEQLRDIEFKFPSLYEYVRFTRRNHIIPRARVYSMSIDDDGE